MMTVRLLVSLGLIALLAGSISQASAQNFGPDEGPSSAIPSAGVIMLTPAQRTTLYESVRRHGMQSSGLAIVPRVGSPVPPSVTLADLPDSFAVDSSGTGLLKYAMVDGDVVIVDPISMRVVDVIHRGATP
jgi:hypothetical protein